MSDNTIGSSKTGKLVVDSRIIAEKLGIKHKKLLEGIKKQKNQLEQVFGRVKFEVQEMKKGNQCEEFALLDEGEAKFVIRCHKNGRFVEINSFISSEFAKANQLREASKSLKEFIDAMRDDNTIKKLGGFVYLIQARKTNCCQIAVCNKPFKRLTTLLIDSPVELVVIDRLFSLDPFKLAAVIQNYYSNHWIRGEWFDLPDNEIKQFVDTANKVDFDIEQKALIE
ncbi:Rha family transcriptional regulator [Laspinema sp. D1]|uniref:Rha family transcriptional regulator n=1 Tax=Laspinema palackyanum D2a TaxID=2953684 RepID=A0ABT2MJY2_9CYAN|nr:Rha family transcriptional regulator [Laspinema sp. D3c]MCT7965045.1 Rha family transcriptional regulator [Laspinema sp. D2a]MCT7992513.1 Rha family transcriptional regulator [Laspinema sp. D3c]